MLSEADTQLLCWGAVGVLAVCLACETVRLWTVGAVPSFLTSLTVPMKGLSLNNVLYSRSLPTLIGLTQVGPISRPFSFQTMKDIESAADCPAPGAVEPGKVGPQTAVE